MATCLDVITSAMRLARIIAAGETPESSETVDGMHALQSLYDGWRTGGLFGRLEDVYLSADSVAQEGNRYYVPTGVTLTDAGNAITDECGKTRQPRDLAMYEAVTEAGAQTAMLYDRLSWVSLLNLSQNDEAPLSARGQVGLAACLAVSVPFAAQFGDTATLNPDVRAASTAFLGSLSMKNGSTQPFRKAEYF